MCFNIQSIITDKINEFKIVKELVHLKEKKRPTWTNEQMRLNVKTPSTKILMTEIKESQLILIGANSANA